MQSIYSEMNDEDIDITDIMKRIEMETDRIYEERTLKEAEELEENEGEIWGGGSKY